MYTAHLETLYINKTKLKMVGPLGTMHPYETEFAQISHRHLGDYLTNSLGFDYLPDLQVDGHLSISKRVFMNLSPGEGSYRMYVTGTPLDKALDPYRIKEAVFSSYWDDKKNNMGILFQVVPYTERKK